ncbi:GrpB family protein [Saccharibacillus alkalitolerans]|uniref:GrpB family protein n=1 Tax=Saccharibacillus alkalitolerans TaxID=2705290 RepID=A0ABX0FDB9_9BACL|nr:GrpB family protein [Saccharibacillus alkalitolerans]NGZ77669.1 GrpB family protein [Saccharibacillus alkalitolerans]
MTDERQSDWPVWATEAVEIKAADPAWERQGEEEAERLGKLLAPYGVREVEHIGSTSVPGLPAKPILDLMAKIPSYDELNAVIERLRQEDWHYVPAELDGHGWRRFFVKVERDRRKCHLHLMQEHEERWDVQLRFRDLMRRRPNAVERYGKLKRELAERYNNDREAYTRAKSEFIESVLADVDS